MQSSTFNTPTLFGDHHVTEVRRILLQLDGVTDVYASSAFQVVQVTYDEKRINNSEIEAKMAEAGYLGEWTVPVELGAGTSKANSLRHTAVYETVKGTVAFVQRVNYSGRPLWPCPGMGVVKAVDE